MEVFYLTTKLEKLANDPRTLAKKLGPICSKKFKQRISEFIAADCLEDLRYLPGPRIHELTNNRKNEFSADLKHPLRLLFKSANQPEPRKKDGGWNWQGITKITITEITNTHE